MIDISLNLKYASNGIYQKKKKRMKLPKNLNSQTHMAYFSKKKKKGYGVYLSHATKKLQSARYKTIWVVLGPPSIAQFCTTTRHKIVTFFVVPAFFRQYTYESGGVVI